MKKKKNKEGRKNKKRDGARKVKITNSQSLVKKSNSGLTLDDIENKKRENAKFQNLVSALILVSGLFVGSLFVDVAQFVTKSGYSERALREADVFELGDKTWVAYEEPMIKVDILVAKNDEDCAACDADEILVWMKKFIPTMAVNEVEEDSKEGQKLIEEFDLKIVPSFVFNERIQEASFYKDPQIQEIFNKKNNSLVLNSTALGIPAGKYIKAPGEESGDIVVGKKEAKVKITTFFDFQCPYCKIFYEAVNEAKKDFSEDELALVYKPFPLDLNGQAISAVLAGQCAYQQGKFSEMADILFANQKEWSLAENFSVFEKYAGRILGMDLNRFKECSANEENRNLIQTTIEQGDDFGVTGTPSSFIENEFLDGIFQKDDIVETVKEYLKNNN